MKPGKDDDVDMTELKSESSATLAVAVTRRGTALPSGEQSGQTACATSQTLDTSALTFDISDLLAKEFLWESQSLQEQVMQNVNSAEARQLSVNAQGFVMKGPCIVVPDGSDLRTLIIRETREFPYAGHYGLNQNSSCSW